VVDQLEQLAQEEPAVARAPGRVEAPHLLEERVILEPRLRQLGERVARKHDVACLSQQGVAPLLPLCLVARKTQAAVLGDRARAPRDLLQPWQAWN
jgi:hypothetical protein